ncbi:MAG: SGNH/GDSL hydrolase family protein [Cyanobacteria bacterium]|nr:SGNH/GDSL hydrolase family protein [Cyanobacteriota bacterium]MDW8200001.1 SGNH/GDSL hydrolase family protein [Cyanobacteriota bacterium SKYGB_h_bin112]
MTHQRLRSSTSKQCPRWVLGSLALNGLLILALVITWQDRQAVTLPQPSRLANSAIAARTFVNLGPRHKLTYEEWVDLLRQEAQVVAATKPSRLAILAGDSITLWFPPDLLPVDRIWLNQGISGETSAGLMKRLALFDQTQPETIFVLIGINDLIRGIAEATVLANQQQIVRYLKSAHPKAQIVVQSILPHAADGAIWEGRKQLLTLSNDRIRRLNRQLMAMAANEGVFYLDLHPLFVDNEGNLRSDLTTDGLHLSPQGYWVWRSAIQVYSQVALKPVPP